MRWASQKQFLRRRFLEIVKCPQFELCHGMYHETLIAMPVTIVRDLDIRAAVPPEAECPLWFTIA